MKHNANLENEDRLKAKLKVMANVIIVFTCLGVFIAYAGIVYMSLKGIISNNEIGDALGGILSPLIGLVSAILIYITIDQQIEANRSIQKQFKTQQVAKFEETIFEEVKRELASLQIDINSFEEGQNIVSFNASFKQIINKIYSQFNNSDFDDNEKNIIRFFNKYIDSLSLFSSNVLKSDALHKILENRIKFFDHYFDSNLDKSFFLGIIRPFKSRLLEVRDYEYLANLVRYYFAKTKIYKNRNGKNEEYAKMVEISKLLNEIRIDFLDYRELLFNIFYSEIVDDANEAQLALKVELVSFYKKLDKKHIYDIENLKLFEKKYLLHPY